MLKNKRILFIIFVAIALFLIPSVCNAVETYTTADGIKVTKIVENTDGTIDFKFENIALSEEGQYTWGIGVTTKAEDVDEWYTLADYGESSKVAVITLTPQDNKIKQILRTNDTVWLYIKDIENNNYIVNALRVNLTLPISKVFPVEEDEETTTFRSFEIKNSVYGIRDIYYKFVKVTDQTLIDKYLAEIKDKKTPSSDNYADRSQAPETGWKAIEGNYGSAGFYINPKPTEPGLYYIWIKGKDADSKTVIGCHMYYGDINEPEVKRIYVDSPLSGTYATGQTVKIRVVFSEPITGSTVPKLKIKFGESAVREITNGTIVNSTNGLENYILYSYDIQSSDKGQLATVEYTGGNIKDTSGNNATLSCPLITGYTIKANVEGTNNTQTDNLDKDTNTQTPTAKVTSIAITKAPTKTSYKVGETFDKAGMVVTATYSDGSKKEITNYTVSPSAALKLTDKKVAITYNENGVTKNVEQNITVTAKTTNDTNNKENSTSKDDTPKDTTTKGDIKLPQTGATVISLVAIILLAVALISKVRYGKLKDI